MDKYLIFVRKYPWLILLILIGGCFLASLSMGNVTMDSSPDSFMKKNDPARQIYDRTMSLFGSDTILMIYLEDEDLFTVEKLNRLYDLVSLFTNQSEFPGIRKVESLYTVNNIKGYPEYLDNGPLMDRPPETQEEALKVRDLAVENSVLVDNLITKDGRGTVINLYLEPFTSGYDKEINSIMVKKIENILFNKENGYNQHFEVMFDIGTPYIVEAIADTILHDMGTILPLSLIVLLIMLMITTGTINGAILPFITSMLSIFYTVGFMGAMNLPVNMLTFSIPLLVIVIGSTEDVHILSEYMAGIRKTGKRDLAIRYMGRAIGTAVFLTALTTFLGFLSISINKIVVLRQFGLAAGFTMFINPVVTFLIAPIYLRYFGAKTFKTENRKPGFFSRGIARLSTGILNLISRRSRLIVAIFLSVGLIIGLFTRDISVDNDSVGYFRKTSAIPHRIAVVQDRLSGSQLFFITLRRKTVEELLEDNACQPPMESPVEENPEPEEISLFDDSMDLFQSTEPEDKPAALFEETVSRPAQQEQLNFLFQDPKYLRLIEDIQTMLVEEYPFDNSTSIADYITLMHREMNAGQPGHYDSIPDPADPQSGNLIAQYAMNLHHDDISTYVTSDWMEANIMVRHHITSTRRIQDEEKKLWKDIAVLVARVDPMLEFQITGESLLTNNAADTIIISQTLGLSLLLVTILIIMSILFMNFKAGLVSLIPNMFPLFILYGLMGIFKIPLNVGTSMVGAIAIGLTVDDTIHFMTRFNQEMRIYQNREEAVKAVVTSEIRPVISTSVALILGFGILSFARLMPMVYFGILSAIVMFFALLADLFLTPILLSSLQLTNLADIAALRLAGELKYSPLFKGMSMLEIKKITLLGQTVTCGKDEHIIRSGEMGREMYVILKGKAHVERHSPGGDKLLFIDEVSTGALLGEISLLRNVPRSANVIAKEEVTYLKIDWDGLMRLQKSAKKSSITLYRNIAAIMGQRLVEITDKLEEKQREEA